MSEPVRHAISVVIKNDKGEVLFTKRSANKTSYPLAWSLPSHYAKDKESPADTVKRIGQNKLGVDLKIGKMINEGLSEREDFTLFMHDYEAVIVNGAPQLVSNDYTEIKWSDPEKQFASMSVMGDCCRLYKESLEKI